MIRACRTAAMAQDDAAMVPGWNISPNVAYTLILIPGASACSVLLYTGDESALVANGSVLTGAAQPCVLFPMSGQMLGMLDADLGWHLLVTTAGTESGRRIRIGPVVDLSDEIHPVYADDAMALARATAAVDAATHYPEDITVTCPNGVGAGIKGVIVAPVDGAPVVGQGESITWTGTPDGATEQIVIRRHVAIAPPAHVAPPSPPTVSDDSASIYADSIASGNVLTNDGSGLTVAAVDGLPANVGEPVAGTNGGTFVINADGSWTFDPTGITVDSVTVATYHASNGEAEARAYLSITVTVRRIEFVASAVGGTKNGGASAITMSIPAETEPGDLVLVIHGMKRTSDYAVGVTDPSGYTEIADLYANDSNDTNLSVSYKIMGGSVDETVTVNASGHAAYANAALLQVWRNVNQSSPIDVTTTTATGIDGTNANPPAIAPVTAGAVVISVIGVTSNNPCTLTPPATPDNVTLRSVDGDGDAINLGSASYPWTSGALDLGVWTYSGSSVPGTSDSWCAATVALKPA